MFYITSMIVFFLDQLIKYIVTIAMTPNQTVPLIKNILHLTYVQNQGAAFGLFWGWRSILILIGIALVAFMIYFYSRSEKSFWLSISLGSIVGGSLGNLFDRIFRHYVVDIIDLRFPYGPYGWPVFNLADTMINAGIFLLIVMLLFNKEGKNASHSS